MNKIFGKLPIEIINKILLYAPIQPPHFLAWKSGIRIITSCELNSNLSGEIKLIESDHEEEALNEEWFYYLISQEYNI